MPSYVHTLNNFQDFMVTMDRKDWQRSIQIRQNMYFGNQEDSNSVKKNKKSVSNKIAPANFNSVHNMKHFVESTSAKFRDTNQDRLKSLKLRINNLINELYESILTSAY